MIDLATHIIDKKTASFDPTKFEDKYENALLELIKARQAGKKTPTAKAAPRSRQCCQPVRRAEESLAEEGGSTAKSETSRAASKPKPKSGEPRRKSA
jgi:DNA end-binding protein Ku